MSHRLSCTYYSRPSLIDAGVRVSVCVCVCLNILHVELVESCTAQSIYITGGGGHSPNAKSGRGGGWAKASDPSTQQKI